jgi:hypothetical protein
MENLLEKRPLTSRAFGSAVCLEGDLGIAGLGSLRQEETAIGQGPGYRARTAKENRRTEVCATYEALTTVR